MKNLLKIGKSQEAAEGDEGFGKGMKQTLDDIYWVLFPMGIAVTVIIGGSLGVKFMMASAEDKAKVKESIVPYVAGCIVIYGAFGIWKICIELFSIL